MANPVGTLNKLVERQASIVEAQKKASAAILIEREKTSQAQREQQNQTEALRQTLPAAPDVSE